MRQLFPDPGEVDPLDAYGRLGRIGDRPAVRLNMIASVDGAASIGGMSGSLGGPADKALFATLRSLADVILVGATTMQAEGYGPVRLSEKARDMRRQWGIAPVPPIAVVTRTPRFDWGSPFFTQAEQRPIVVTTTSAAVADLDRAAEVAHVITAEKPGIGGVDLDAAVSQLGELGHDNVLAEGGPGIAAELAVDDLLDEVCLSVSPVLVAGGARRILAGGGDEISTQLELCSLLVADSYLFTRYRRR
ncbi:MAG: pyrimidine reductase family protein [Acidimicrobiales bacterium]|jgi:riboflavin biosynthesis pyrimidine reductase